LDLRFPEIFELTINNICK